MGKQIYLDKIEAIFDKSPLVDFKSLERVIGKTKNSHNLLNGNIL